MHLFVIYIGGSHPDSLIELHDMRFVVANTIEETYDYLKKTWWGIPTSLHIDAWGILSHVDGYDIQITKNKPQKNDHLLYFVNLGGYDPREFTELHKNIFVVASNEIEAKQKAVNQISNWASPHRDYLYQIEHCSHLNTILEKDGYYLELQAQTEYKPFEFTCCYNPIGKEN